MVCAAPRGAGMRRFAGVSALAAITATALVAVPLSAQAASGVGGHVVAASSQRPPLPVTGRSAPLPKTPRQPASLARMGLGVGPAGSGPGQAAVAAAAAAADSSGKPVTVTALTTPTTTVTAGPHGRVSLIEHVLPVRVRRGHGWIPVSTALTRNPDGSLSPAAVPGDAVTFS